MNKIVISGYYGFDNLGDEAVLAGIITSLRTVAKELTITVLSNKPEQTEARFRVKAVNRQNLVAVFKEISNCDLFISGGGSLLQDSTSGRSIPFYLSQVFLAQLMGKKTVFYAQGVGPIKGSFGKFLVKMVGNRTNLITVRDAQSRDLLIDLGVNSDLIELTTDPVFALQGREEPDGDKLLSKTKIKGKRPLIGISVRPWQNNRYLAEMAETIDYLITLTGGEVVIIPMHHSQDQVVSQQLADLVAIKPVVLVDNYSPDEMLAIFSKLDFLVGVRLHSLIFATLKQIPFVALNYDPKVAGFLEMVGVNSLVEIANLKADRLKRVCQVIWENRDYFREMLAEESAVFGRFAYQNAADVLKLLD